MKKKVIISILALILLAVIFIPNMVNSLTGEAVNEPIIEYTYTKAICTDTNFCQDHIITCENTEVLNIVPISGAVVQNSDDWIDPRGEQSRILCK